MRALSGVPFSSANPTLLDLFSRFRIISAAPLAGDNIEWVVNLDLEVCGRCVGSVWVEGVGKRVVKGVGKRCG